MSELILVALVALVANLLACGCETMRGERAIETGKDWVEAGKWQQWR